MLSNMAIRVKTFFATREIKLHLTHQHREKKTTSNLILLHRFPNHVTHSSGHLFLFLKKLLGIISGTHTQTPSAPFSISFITDHCSLYLNKFV